MIKKHWRKAALLLLAFALATVLLVKGLDVLNEQTSRSVTAADGVVSVDSRFNGGLCVVEGVESAAGSLRFSVASDGRALTLLIDGLKFGYRIEVDGRLVSQNTDQAAEGYDASYAYQALNLQSESPVSIEISGSGVSQVKLFLADADAMRDSLELRTICNSVMLMSLVLFTLISLLLYFGNRLSKLFLLFAVMGAVSIVKSVNHGELFVLIKALGVTFRQYTPVDDVTAAINLVLPLFVMLSLFDLFPRRKLFRAGIISIAVLLSAFSLWLGHRSLLYAAYASIVYFASLLLSIYGCLRGKRFSGVIMLNSIVYSSFTLYTTFVYRGIFRYGVLGFYVNTSYLGALIYLCVFLAVYIGYSFQELRSFEEQKKRYERLSLLRGISHDLRLPLSVIKMNNQMIEKYPMDEAERRECARMSIDAVRELENMTGNINSYLNLEDTDGADALSSVRCSFDRVGAHYAAYSKGTGIQFHADWQGDDRMLRVKEFLLDRLLYNLVDNAFKYNRPGGTVLLACRTDGESAAITVEDTGVGMDRDTVENVFTPFYRSDQSRSKEGLGLGLSVVQGIIDSLGGRIAVTSSPGAGTRIEVCLPFEK